MTANLIEGGNHCFFLLFGFEGIIFWFLQNQTRVYKTGNLILPLNLLFLPLYWLGIGVGLGFVGQGSG